MKPIIFLLLFFTSSLSLAGDAVVLDWDNLRPEIPKNEIALPDLSDEQLAQIQRIYSLMHSQQEDTAAKIAEIKLELQKQNIDADEVFRLREEYMREQQLASEALTKEFDGERVRIPGFLVPLAFTNAMVTTDFLLVPFAGACIHVPPPPANQIVRVSFPEGYEMRSIRDPIWVEGKINSNLQSDDLYIVDGTSNITMGYALEATVVVDYN